MKVLLPLVLVASALAATLAAAETSAALPAGRYALVLDVHTSADVPVLGGVRSRTTTLALVDVVAEGGRLSGRQRVCEVRLGEDGGLARTVFPTRLARALPARSFVLDVEGARLSADLGTEALGFALQESRGRLPASTSDPALVDVDKDGRPGATLWLEVKGVGRFPLSVVSRGRTVLEGRVVSRGRAEGKARLVEFEQRILEGLPVQGEVSDVAGDPEKSRFVLERVPIDSRCEDLTLAGEGLRLGVTRR